MKMWKKRGRGALRRIASTFLAIMLAAGTPAVDICAQETPGGARVQENTGEPAALELAEETPADALEAAPPAEPEETKPPQTEPPQETVPETELPQETAPETAGQTPGDAPQDVPGEEPGMESPTDGIKENDQESGPQEIVMDEPSAILLETSSESDTETETGTEGESETETDIRDAYTTPDMDRRFAEVYGKAGSYLYYAVKQPTIASVGGDWAVIGLARAGYVVDGSYYNTYAQNVSNATSQANGVLHDSKYTEYSRVILALTAAGYDVTNVAGYNLLAPLAEYENVVWQGDNGPVWALIALDSHDYGIPAAKSGVTQTTRENLLDAILQAQLDDGGWSISGLKSDADMTAMALQALAPYYTGGEAWYAGSSVAYARKEQIKSAVDKGLTYLSAAQDASGGFESFGRTNCESCAQVLAALVSLGIDPESDGRFLKNKRSVLDALLSYAVSSGGFAHIIGGGADGMASEQGYYALVAYQRYLSGKNRLYDMMDTKITKSVPQPAKQQTEKEPETQSSEKGDSNKNKGDKNSSSGNKTSGNSRPGGSTRSLGNTGSGRTLSGGDTMTMEQLEDGMVAVTVNGKRYVVDEDSADLIAQIRELSENKEEPDVADVVALYRKYQDFSEEQQAYVLNYEELETMMEQVGEKNHLDEKTLVQAEELDWYVRLNVKQEDAGDEIYTELQESLGGARLQRLYEISLMDLLTGREYKPGGEVTIRIPKDEDLEELRALLEKESSSGAAARTSRSGRSNAVSKTVSLGAGTTVRDDPAKDMETGEETESETGTPSLMVVHCHEDGSIEYPDCTEEDGMLVFQTKDFSHFGVLEASAESALTLQEEPDTETEAGTEAETAAPVPEEQASSQKAGYSGPLLPVLIVLLVLGTDLLVLAALGKKGYLNFGGKD